MHKSMVVICCCSLLTACVTASSNSALSESDAKAALLASLKDPDSAKILKMHRVNNYYCGQVNSKNSFGGYTGVKVFSVSATGEALIAGESTALGVWASPCWEDHFNGGNSS